MKLNIPYFLRKPKFSRKSHSTKLYWRKCRKTLQYDKKHSKAVFYTVGTNVLKKDFRKKKRKGGCKLDVMWVGPYLIPKSLGKGFYELQSCGKGRVTTIPRVSHVHIKVYKSLSCSPSRKLQSPSASNESPSTPSNITHPVLHTNSNMQPASSIILQTSSASDTLFCPSSGQRFTCNRCFSFTISCVSITYKG